MNDSDILTVKRRDFLRSIRVNPRHPHNGPFWKAQREWALKWAYIEQAGAYLQLTEKGALRLKR